MPRSFRVLTTALVLLPLLAADARGQQQLEVFRDCDRCPEMVVMPGGGLALGRY